MGEALEKGRMLVLLEMYPQTRRLDFQADEQRQKGLLGGHNVQVCHYMRRPSSKTSTNHGLELDLL